MGPNILAEGKLKYPGTLGNCSFVVLSNFPENSQLKKKKQKSEEF